jgi:hypothetical protein
MINISLDVLTDFIFSADERPAGQWMEGYWAEIAHWAKYFAFAIWAYFGWLTYSHFKAHTAIILVFYIPIAYLGYFCFQFSRVLKRALAERDQLLLQDAFRKLYSFLILGLVATIFGLLSSINEWSITIKMLSNKF